MTGPICNSDDEGFYVMPLPFRQSSKPQLPDNKHLALKRLLHLRKKLKSDSDYCRDYSTFMNDMIARGDVEEVPVEDLQASPYVWYIPHHGVYHKKKQKLRIVFDCSSKYRGTCLNNHLLQGPDLMNSLLGCLIRFRERPVAVAADIEKMFYRFRVKPEDKDYLRFLWWKGGHLDSEPTVYRMRVHLFGATSSPGCANFGLKRLAEDHKNEYSEDVCRFIKDEFYVDDGLISCWDESEAITIIQGARELCQRANIRLHKFVSNSKVVMDSIPITERATEAETVKLPETAIERILGIEWDVKSDQFKFRLVLDKKPMTRRGILSTIASVFDPLGFLSPFVLIGKQILQEMCKEHLGWDDELSDGLRMRWERWLCDLPRLAELKIPRCILPDNFDNITQYELHHFSDASFDGYGQCTYVRLINSRGEVFCSLVIGKSRVTPLRVITMPRLELTAALVSLKISNLLREEMRYDDVKEYFWTDSKIVLGYIQNDAKRFHVFVSNRVQQIRSASRVDQWRYVKSADNPADDASRGLLADDLLKSNWLYGPDFLWDKKFSVDEPEIFEVELDPDDPEIKKVNVFHIEVTKPMIERFKQFSRWSDLITAVAALIRRIRRNSMTTVEDRQRSEKQILRLIQIDAFEEERHLIEHGQRLPRGNHLYQLDPFLDEDGILRVGGRLQKSSLTYDLKHPVVLPKSGHLIDLIIRHCHEKVAHQGRGFTQNEVRSRGYWILSCSRAVSSLIYKCITCRKFRGKPQEQKMANLPEDRLEEAPPFSYCGIDCFGPFLIKEGRRQLKRWGLLVTCMASRAVHIEVLDDMTTDCFINSLRCVIALRGRIRLIRCDQGTNFVGAARILQEALGEIKEDEVRRFLAEHQCDFLMNTPHSSHMGGSWERHIRTIRGILATMMDQHSSRLDTATLRTFMYETMAIINSRPLSPQNLNDPLGSEPLTPNHLIMMKSKPLLPPPGNFVREDVYARKRWRKVQFLADEFWRRWKLEYMSTLQNRKKWNKVKRNVTAGDIVILKDEAAYRGDWRLAKVQSTITDADGLVRRVTLVMGDSNLTNRGRRVSKQVILERPIHKLIVLIENQG